MDDLRSRGQKRFRQKKHGTCKDVFLGADGERDDRFGGELELGLNVRESVRLYWHLRPVGLNSFLRFYLALAFSLFLVVFARSRFRSTGHLTLGRSRLRVTTSGVLVEVQPGNNSLALLAGAHEPRTTSWFRVKPGDVVVDVGAHVGRYSLIAAKNASRVISIEPDPSNFALLESNIKLNGFSNILPMKLAASNNPGRRRFYLSGGGDSGTSSLEKSWSWALDKGVTRRELDVECETLDRLVMSLKLDHIDWLKVDVEGHELAVLEGARDTLGMTGKLILEVAEGNEAECNKIVEEAGFRLIAADEGPKEQGLRSSSNWMLQRTNS